MFFVFIADLAAPPTNNALGPKRTAAAFCKQVRAAVKRSRARGRAAIVAANNASTHTESGLHPGLWPRRRPDRAAAACGATGGHRAEVLVHIGSP